MEHLALPVAEQDRDRRLAVLALQLGAREEHLAPKDRATRIGYEEASSHHSGSSPGVDHAAQERVLGVADLDADHVVGGRVLVVRDGIREGRLQDVAERPVGGEQAAARSHEVADPEDVALAELPRAVHDQELLGPEFDRAEVGRPRPW